jgi:6-phosphogluconate dehydrogenase
VDHGPAGEPTELTIRTLGSLLQAGDVVIDGGNSYFKDDVRRARRAEAPRRALRRRRHERRRLGRRTRLLPDDRRPAETVRRLQPIFETLAPGEGNVSPSPASTLPRLRAPRISALRSERRGTSSRWFTTASSTA